MQVGQLQLQISSFRFERHLRDHVVLQCLDAAKRVDMLGNITKPRTLSTKTCRDKDYCAASFCGLRLVALTFPSMIECLKHNSGKAFEDLVCTTLTTIPSMSGCRRVDHRALTIMGYQIFAEGIQPHWYTNDSAKP